MLVDAMERMGKETVASSTAMYVATLVETVVAVLMAMEAMGEETVVTSTVMFMATLVEMVEVLLMAMEETEVEILEPSLAV